MFNDQGNEFDKNKLTNLDSVSVNRNPNLDNEIKKKFVDDSIGEGRKVRFNQTLQNHLKVSVGNDTYSLTKYDRIQSTDTTKHKFPSIGANLLQNWNILCNDINKNGNLHGSKNQQKQTVQQVIVERRVYLLSVILFDTNNKQEDE